MRTILKPFREYLFNYMDTIWPGQLKTKRKKSILSKRIYKAVIL